VSSEARVIFVYNAESGLFSALSDYVHKIVSPETYSCSLCAVTYGNLGMRRAWAQFVKSLPARVIFTYRDRLRDEDTIMKSATLPAAFIIDNQETRLVLTAEEIGRCESEADLIALCTENLLPLLVSPA